MATAFAAYVASVDDTQPPTEFSANWVLGGPERKATKEAIEESILRVPTPYKIVPYEEMSAANRNKVNIVEMCNPLFAKQALGVLPVVDNNPTTKIIDGYIHAPALPCEVAIYADEDGNIYAEMENPKAIFALFFTAALFGEQMEDPAFAAEILALPSQVNGEIQAIIYAALEDGVFDYRPVSEPLGPGYRINDRSWNGCVATFPDRFLTGCMERRLISLCLCSNKDGGILRLYSPLIQGEKPACHPAAGCRASGSLVTLLQHCQNLRPQVVCSGKKWDSRPEPSTIPGV